MKTDRDSVASFEYAASQLILAGWLRSFEFVEDEGYIFRWTRKGMQRVFLIQRVIEDFRLTDYPSMAKEFTDACLDPPRFPDSCYSTACRDFWLSCLDELSLECDESHLAAFTAIVAAEIQHDQRSTANPAYLHSENPVMAHG